MYHAHFRGTHYEAGFRWGSLLFKHKNLILDHIPFEITGERVDYAFSCIPIYEKYYPEILEELRGLADGQGCDVRALEAVLLSMYSIPPSCGCSCFAALGEGNVLFGRNSDFLTEMEKLNLNVIYDLSDGAYSFTGNTTAFVEMEDGVNEHGLAVGLTSVYPSIRRPGFHAGLLLRCLLEKCRSVSEALTLLGKLPIGSSQTLTLADSCGNIAMVECNCEQMEVIRPENQRGAFVCATNTFHIPDMVSYNKGEMDNWYAEIRYQTLSAALGGRNQIDVPFAKRLLSGEFGFLCQYDRNSGKDTVWSVVYDLGQRMIYRSEGNPGRKSFRQDTRFSF